MALEGCSRNAENGKEALEIYNLCFKFLIGLMSLPQILQIGIGG
jgi:hypothetical protein